MNCVAIAGNVGSVRGPNDVGDKRVLNFSIAVNEGRDRTTWFDCALWGDRADKLAPYITKGKMLAVTGSVSGDVYEGKPQLKVFVRDLTLPPKGVQDSAPFRSFEQQNVNEFEDDIPF